MNTFILVSVLVLIVIWAAVSFHLERRAWNKGICRKNSLPWVPKLPRGPRYLNRPRIYYARDQCCTITWEIDD